MAYVNLPRELLMRVQKPARYTGGEYNSPKLKPDAPLQFLMCFPDIYEVGMSNLGIKILIGALNGHKDVSCERCFAPWADFKDLMEQNAIPLFSIDSLKTARSFDMLGFSLQYELSFTATVKMLELAGISPLASMRNDDEPLIIAGGPCTVNPEPFKDFFDLMVIGDGEEAILQLADAYLQCGKNRKRFLRTASGIRGVFVPSIHTDLNKLNIKKAVVEDLNSSFFPLNPTVASIETIHDRIVLEVFRGCTRGCRFCQAGFIYRPIREKSTETLLAQAEQLLKNTGYDEISLSSLSTGDYPDILNLTNRLGALAEKLKARFGLPSLRLDSFNPNFLPREKKSLVTFAPEAGTQRLRNVINKNITDADIENSLSSCFENGFFNIKLYFMTGLPTETKDDLLGIVEICKKAKQLAKNYLPKGKRLNLTVSTAVFIPKPFTPFQWEAQKSMEMVIEEQSLLKLELHKLGVNYNYHDILQSRIEAVFARGDSRLNKVLLNVVSKGAYLEGWSEFFDYNRWLDAFYECGLDLDSYLRGFDISERLPWDYIDILVSKKYLLSEREKSLRAETTGDCRDGCFFCGVC